MNTVTWYVGDLEHHADAPIYEALCQEMGIRPADDGAIFLDRSSGLTYVYSLDERRWITPVTFAE